MDIREKKSDTLKAIELILGDEAFRQEVSGMANDAYKAPDFIHDWIYNEFFERIPEAELAKNFVPGAAYIDFTVVVAAFTEAETYVKNKRWKLVEKMSRGYRDEDEEKPGFYVGMVTVLQDSGKAILCRMDDGDGEEEWFPKSVIHDDSEAFEEGGRGKLIITEW